MFTNLKLLNDFLDKSGYKKTYIAQFLGISKASLFNKITGKTDFTISEVNRMKVLINLTNNDIIQIFFNANVTGNPIFEIL